MDTSEFVASLVSSLAWPTTVLVAVVVLRKPLVAILTGPAIKRLKVGPGGVEVERWDSALSEVRSEVLDAVDERPALSQPRTSSSPTWNLDLPEGLAELATVAPAMAVLESFRRIETELRELVQGTLDEGLTVQRLPVAELTQLALKNGLITPETENAIRGLSVLRNLAAHGSATDVDTGRALEFAALTDAVLFAIRNAKPRRTE